jgi:molybdopterin synthase sulfur carrier subunit
LYHRRVAIVRLRGQLEKVAGVSEHRAAGDTVSELLQALEREQTALEGWILDERGQIRQHINVFVNGEQAQADSAVSEEDKIEILPAISGG